MKQYSSFANILQCLCFGMMLALYIGCSQQQPRYTIGISQCSEDIWRDKQNAEFRMGAYLQNNVELRFAVAHDSDERQVQQIDSLLRIGIDLLIVAPNQLQTISPAIDRAYDSGIPVIVFERKTSSQKFTAFISADNYEMGRVMGEYIISQLNGKGNVLVVKGLEGSSPAIERHKGFLDVVKQAPDIKVLASLQGDWTEKTAYESTKKWLAKNKDIPVDFVFGLNDRTAIGARKAFLSVQSAPLKTKFCGIDGLPGKNGGISLVLDGILDASYIYPTNGDLLIDEAVRILEKQPYEKEMRLMSALVTRDNAKVLLMQNDAMERQANYLDRLHARADNYLHELDGQRVINWLALGIIILLLIVFVLFYLYYLRKITLQRERVVSTLWNMETKEAEPQATSSIMPADEGTNPTMEDDLTEKEIAEAATMQGDGTSMFITRFREVVEARLEDSDLSVDDLAADMSLSRVQLYRKVKAVTGSSPVELLRTARLARAYQLLLTSDKTVSEVAYAVGFTAPSYFTKCFKEEYGMVPGNVRKTEE